MLKISRLFYCFFLLAMLFLSTVSITLAWPDKPPDRATISGPGLKGEVEITQAGILAALSLGAIEDFEHGSITPPKVGAGYQITRYFYDASFNFGSLHYYPNPEGRDYIFFEDGPDLIGDHSEYNRQWFYATPQGEAAVQSLLKELDVSSDGASLSFVTKGQGWPSIWLVAGSTLMLLMGLFYWWRR